MTAKPTVSVIINTYNYGRFVEETIESALAQDYPEDRREILVIDDGSTDDTGERVKKYCDRIKYFYKENGDQCSAITFGVAHSKGDLLAFLDGDDLWLPNRLSCAARVFSNNPGIVMAYNPLIYWDSRDNSVWEHDCPTNAFGDVLADRNKLLSYIYPPTSSLVFRRSAFERLAEVPLDRAFSYDLYLTTAALFLGPVGFIPEPLTKYRVHGGNRWFAGRIGVDPKTVRRRLARQGAALEIIRDWLRANAPKRLRPQARLIFAIWRYRQEEDQFLLKPPGRVRNFLHRAKQNMIYGSMLTRSHLAYRWAHAVFELIVGPEHSHHVEALRTRARVLRARLRGGVDAQTHGEAVGRKA
jgi:glycosyltransferase involved in cell wall biosynthesis